MTAGADGTVDHVEVLYVSSVPTPAQFQRLKDSRLPGAQEGTYGMAESGFKFHTLIQDGLHSNGVRITSIVGRSVAPHAHRGRWWRRVVEEVAPGHVVDHRAFPNSWGLKQLWLAASFTYATVRWRLRTRRATCRVVVADAAYVSALPGVLFAARGGGIRRVAIVADVYSYMADVSDASDRSRSAYALIRKAMARIYREIDGFVLLTEQMNPIVNPAGRPHMVMEGLVDRRMVESDNSLVGKDPQPTVLYAGALRREYGLATLVDGFRALEDPSARLVIYGAGDFADEVGRAASEDERIDFRGTAPTDVVVRAEERAWLLVNPRPADAEFTKYSFPSKNMEYLASGTPVVTTRLPGMPSEYYDYVLTVDGPGPEDVAEALRSALSQSREVLHERGDRGKVFVLEHKNNVVQARRIIEFAKECK